MNAQDEARLRFAAEDAGLVLIGVEKRPVCYGDTLHLDPSIDEIVSLDGVLVDDGRRPWQFVAALALAVGFAAGLLLAVALIPDQPDRVIVPVEAPAGFIAPDPGTWSA